MKAYWVAKMIVFVLVVSAVIGYVVMLLWNWLMPDIFNLPKINYWQAIGLLLLSKIFFHGKKEHDWAKYKSKAPKTDAMGKQLAPEERERLKEVFKKRWCSKGYEEPSERPHEA